MSDDKKKKACNFEIELDLDEALEKDYKQKKIEKGAWLNEAVRHFLTCEKPGVGGMLPKILNWPGTCVKCGQKVEAGQWALWGKGIGIICMDCYVARIGDKGVIVKYLKNRELDRVRNALKEECDRLAGKVETLQVLNKLEDLKNQQEQIISVVNDFLTHKIGSSEEAKALEEFLRQIQDGKRIILDMDEFIKNYIRNRKWRKQIYREEESPLEQEQDQQG
jgi:hypothetical protein